MWASAILTRRRRRRSAAAIWTDVKLSRTEEHILYTAGTRDEKNLFTTRQISSVYSTIYYVKICVARFVLNLTWSTSCYNRPDRSGVKRFSSLNYGADRSDISALLQLFEIFHDLLKKYHLVREVNFSLGRNSALGCARHTRRSRPK